MSFQSLLWFVRIPSISLVVPVTERAKVMSKRSFADADILVPPEVWALFPEEERELSRIRKVESEVGQLFTHRQRSTVMRNSDVEVVQKICRVYVSHEFVNPTSVVDASGRTEKIKGYCLVTVQGILLDPEYNKHISFASLWDQIQMSVSQ